VCLGELARVRQLATNQTAVVEIGSREVTVSLLTLDEPVGTGDWLLIHSGFALSRLTDDEARDALTIRSTRKEDLP
jgi:hydrogenase expression/formation protein HypC